VGSIVVGGIHCLLVTGAQAQTDEIQVYDVDINSPGQFSAFSCTTTKSRHSLRIAGARQRAGDDDPVVAGEHPGEAPAVTLCQKLPQAPLPVRVFPASILSCLVPASPA
jgi:hypothetical protein